MDATTRTLLLSPAAQMSVGDMGIWFLLLGLLLLPLVATDFFLRRRKPLLGFALGALPLFLLWLALVLRTELTLYQCSRDVTLMCELTGLGIYIPTLVVIGILTLDGLVLALIDFADQRSKRQKPDVTQYQGISRRPLWLSLLFVIVVGLLGLLAAHWLTVGLSWPLTLYWLVPMLALAGTITYVVNNERKISPG